MTQAIKRGPQRTRRTQTTCCTKRRTETRLSVRRSLSCRICCRCSLLNYMPSKSKSRELSTYYTSFLQDSFMHLLLTLRSLKGMSS